LFTQVISRRALNRILFAAALSGMSAPALASAELSYNSIDAGYSTTSFANGARELTVLKAGISKSLPANLYLMASYGSGTQLVGAAGSRKEVSVSAGVGFHFPIKNNIDAIAEAHIAQTSAKLQGNSTNANGNEINAGIRWLFIPSLEGTLRAAHANISDGTSTSQETFVKTQIGYYLTRSFQMTAGMDFTHNMTTSLGLRLFF
jgi:hypothetical protein